MFFFLHRYHTQNGQNVLQRKFRNIFKKKKFLPTYVSRYGVWRKFLFAIFEFLKAIFKFLVKYLILLSVENDIYVYAAVFYSIYIIN